MAEKKSIIVTECTAGYTGLNRNQNPYTIYDIKATNPDGSPITVDLRSFDELPLGPGEYEVEPYVKDGKTTYTLKGGRRSGGGGGVTAEQHAALARRVDVIEAALQRGRSDVTPGVADFGGEAPATPPTQPDMAFGGVDDIPF